MGEEEPCGGAGNGSLEILCKTSASAEPGEGSFHYPASRQKFEPGGGVGALDDLYGPFADFGEASIEFGTGIAAVGEYVPQPRIQGFDGFEYVGRPVPILNTGMMNDRTDEMTDCIGDDLALASLDLLSGIEPARPAGLGGLDRLAVDHTGCGRRLEPRRESRRLQLLKDGAMEKQKTSVRYLPEVREQAVRMVLEHGKNHADALRKTPLPPG